VFVLHHQPTTSSSSCRVGSSNAQSAASSPLLSTRPRATSTPHSLSASTPLPVKHARSSTPTTTKSTSTTTTTTTTPKQTDGDERLIDTRTEFDCALDLLVCGVDDVAQVNLRLILCFVKSVIIRKTTARSRDGSKLFEKMVSDRSL
jgi:hypothetical protein